jgi:hypothetical protein
MNPGQEMFYNFFMEQVEDGKKDEANVLLEDAFTRQTAGTFDKAYSTGICVNLSLTLGRKSSPIPGG